MANEILIDVVNNLKLLTTNNYPLCDITNNCDGTEDIVSDPITDEDRVLVLPATYDLIAQNILSFPKVIDTSIDNYYVTTYTLPGDKKIIKTVDMRTENKIINTLSGDVPNGVDLVKIITINDDNITEEFN